MKKIVTLLVAFVVLAGCSFTEKVENQKSDWVSFKSERLGFEFSYPDDFKVEEPSMGGGVSIFTVLSDELCIKAGSAVRGCGISFSVSSLGKYDGGLQGFSKSDKWAALDEYKNTIFNGFSALERVGQRLERGERDESYMSQRRIFFESNDGDIYVVMLDWPKSLENEADVKSILEIYDTMIDTVLPL